MHADISLCATVGCDVLFNGSGGDALNAAVPAAWPGQHHGRPLSRRLYRLSLPGWRYSLRITTHSDDWPQPSSDPAGWLLPRPSP